MNLARRRKINYYPMLRRLKYDQPAPRELRLVDTRTLEYQYQEHLRATAHKFTIAKYLKLKCKIS
jgi:hypothetical protein